MAYTSIDKHKDHFNTKLYTGNETTGHSITGVGFQPDFTWIKNRTNGKEHHLFDAVRGATKFIETSTTDAEETDATTLSSFNSDGFTLGNSAKVNANSMTTVSWNWKAGNSAGSSNTDGSITSTVSANTTAGFSIVKYTGTGSAATIGHGLGVAPALIIVKADSTAGYEWFVFHKSEGATNRLKLNSTTSSSSSTFLNNTTPSTTVFNTEGGAAAGESRSYIAYCFAEKTGYSKMGSYTGNNSSSGVFVYTGFKPKFIMFKKTNGTADWRIYDSERAGYNNKNYYLRPNGNGSEITTDSGSNWDMLSNGFKFYTSEAGINDGGNYIYYAVGQSLVGSNNVPCTAR